MTTIAAEQRTFAIAQVAEKTGVSAHTLRYYERIGLLDVGRRESGHRRYTEKDVERVIFIGRLRATAMPIREVLRYFDLVARGRDTENERLALLQEHRTAVLARLGELEAALGAIELKIAHYGGTCVR